MSNLPTPGGDQGKWGDILNDFLLQAHKPDGTIKNASIGAAQLTSSVIDSLDKADSALQNVDVSGKADDSAVVHKSTTETITGAKDFTGGLTINGQSIAVRSSNSIDTGKAIDAYTGNPLVLQSGTDMGFTSVKESPYNATADGTTDDAVAIQDAIDDVSAAGGGVVYFPSGTYRIGTRIQLSSNVSLIGADRQKTKLQAISGITTSVLVGLSGSAVTDVLVRELTIDADYAGTAGNINGIQITNGNRVIVDRCIVTNIAKTGVLLTTCTDCKLSNSEISYSGQGQASVGFGVLLSGGSDSKIHDNEFYACNGMNIGGNTNALNASVVNNLCDHTATPRTTVSGSGQNPASTFTLTVASTAGFPPNGTLSVAGIVGAITYTGLTSTTFTGCSGASGTAMDGGVTRNGYESIGFTDGCENWLVKGNRSIDSGDNGISASANNSVVEGNIIDSPQFHGIAVAGGTNSLIIGNSVRNVSSIVSSGYSGIRITDQANSIIALNRIYDDRGGSAMMRSGIREQNNSTNGTYVGNRITGHLSLEYELASTSTSQLVEPRRFASVTVAAATTVQTDVATSRLRRVTVSSGDNFTIGQPTNEFTGAIVTYIFSNTSGSTLGTITWDEVFKLAGTWTSPANGESKGISFVFDGTSWIETAGTSGSGSSGGNANLETAVATFARNTVAAGANSNLACNALFGTSNVVRWPLMRSAVVVGVSIAPVSALSGGTLTAKITKNGSVQAALNTTISSGESTKVLDLGYASGVSFAAGETIGVLIDTDVSYAPAQNVIVLVHYTTT